jgi:hypothetical protein
MIFASLKHFLDFSENREKMKTFYTREELATAADGWTRE